MSRHRTENYIEVFRQFKRYISEISDAVKDKVSIEDMAVINMMLDRLIDRIERREFRLFSPSELKLLEKVRSVSAEEFNARLAENEERGYV